MFSFLCFPCTFAQVRRSAAYYFGHICGASLIDKQHVLTAAHCIMNEEVGVKKAKGTNFRVAIGGGRQSLTLYVPVYPITLATREAVPTTTTHLLLILDIYSPHTSSYSANAIQHTSSSYSTSHIKHRTWLARRECMVVRVGINHVLVDALGHVGY